MNHTPGLFPSLFVHLMIMYTCTRVCHEQLAECLPNAPKFYATYMHNSIM